MILHRRSIAMVIITTVMTLTSGRYTLPHLNNEHLKSHCSLLVPLFSHHPPISATNCKFIKEGIDEACA